MTENKTPPKPRFPLPPISQTSTGEGKPIRRLDFMAGLAQDRALRKCPAAPKVLSRKKKFK